MGRSRTGLQIMNPKHLSSNPNRVSCPETQFGILKLDFRLHPIANCIVHIRNHVREYPIKIDYPKRDSVLEKMHKQPGLCFVVLNINRHSKPNPVTGILVHQCTDICGKARCIKFIKRLISIVQPVWPRRTQYCMPAFKFGMHVEGHVKLPPHSRGK